MLTGVVGRYRILSRIGQGGMGVVYKALDTTLDRMVAIKAIREELSHHPDAAERLRSEARLAASIDHPYICKVHELFETAENTLVVMEYVEGDTLAVLQGQELSIAEAIRIAQEVAEALSVAHARGLVHRDIKPSNIMITPHQHVKLMDFGIARIQEAPGHPDGEKTRLTQPGFVVGSPRYMSPEQAMGDAAGPASDIFSLGVVLFECLSGRLPFEGDTRQSYMRNLLASQPARLDLLRREVPPALRKVVEKCLEKEPPNRYAAASELAGDLNVCSQDLLSSSAGWGAYLLKVLAAAAVLTFVLLLFLYAPWRATETADRDPYEDVQATQSALVTWPSREEEGRLSPDGQWVSFISNRSGRDELWLSNLTGGVPRSITATEGNILSQTWSPDGSEIAYLARYEEGTFLQIIPFNGGQPRQVIPIDPSVFRLGRWLANHIYVEYYQALVRFSTDDGTRTDVLPPAGTFDFRHQFDVSENEKQVLFLGRRGGQEDLWLLNLDGGEPIRLTDDPSLEATPRFAGPQNILFLSNRTGQMNLWSLDLKDRRVRSLPVGGNVRSIHDVSRDGSMLTLQTVEEEANLWWLDPAAGATRLLTRDSLKDLWPSFSADGKMTAFQRGQPSLQGDFEFFETQLLVSQWEGGTFGEPKLRVSEGFAAELSFDGRYLAHLRRAQDSTLMELWIKDLQSQQSKMVSRRFRFPGFYPFPTDLVSSSIVWMGDCPDLYFVETSPAGIPGLRKYCPRTEGQESELIFAAPMSKSVVSDLVPGRHGDELGFLLWSGDGTPESRVMVFDVSTRTTATLYREKAAVSRQLSLKGSLDDKSWILLRIHSIDQTQAVKILRVANGASEILGTAEPAFGFGARLDPARGQLYITKLDPQRGFHNIYGFSLTDHTFKRLTDNQSPDTTFSGMEVSQQGYLIYTQQRQNPNIWLVRLKRPRAGE